MSRKQELIEWASLNGLRLPSRSNHFFIDYRTLDQLLAKAKEEEREACAKVCDSVNSYDNPMTANDVAYAIRARGQQ